MHFYSPPTMKAAFFGLCFCILTLRAEGWTEWSHKYDEGKPISGERDYILRIFDFYSQLQRNFEQQHFAPRAGNLVADYTTAILLPACASCAKLLQHGNDTELMLGYF